MFGKRTTAPSIPIYTCFTLFAIIIVVYNSVEFYEGSFIHVESKAYYPNWYLIDLDKGNTVILKGGMETEWCNIPVHYYEMDEVPLPPPPCALLSGVRKIIFAPYVMYISNSSDIIDLSHDPSMITGFYKPDEHLVYISTNTDNLKKTLYHELGHAYVAEYHIDVNPFCKFADKLPKSYRTAEGYVSQDMCEEAFADVFARHYVGRISEEEGASLDAVSLPAPYSAVLNDR